MKTVYFPFTAIEPLQAERLAAVWGPVTLLQPSADTVLSETRRLQEAGTVDLVWPPEGPREGGLQGVLAAFEQWAAQHAGSDRGSLMDLVRAFPLFDSQFPAQLAADIRQGGGRRPEATAKAAVPCAPFEAQLVLALAQKLDCQQVELARAIEAVAAAEEKMVALLRGEEALAGGVTGPHAVAPPTGATAMLTLRLKAWARVMAATADRAESGDWLQNEILFVTDAPDLPAHLNELFPQMRHRLRSSTGTAPEQVEVPPADLPGWLVGADDAPGAATVPRSRDAGCDLIEIPGVAPRAFLAGLAAGRSGPESCPSGGTSPNATWIGCHPPCNHTGGGARGSVSGNS